MVTKFTISWMKSLRNDEHPILVQQICAKMDTYSGNDQIVIDALARMKSHLEPLAKIKTRTRKHELTPFIQAKAQERKQSLISLRGQVAYLTRSTVPEEKSAADVLQRWLGKHRRRLIHSNYNAQTLRVNDLLGECDSVPAIGAAIESLSLRPLAETIRTINSLFNDKFMERSSDRSLTEKVDVKTIRDAADRDLKLLLDVIASSETLDGKGAFANLINSLKELLDYYQALVASRNTRRQAIEKNNDDDGSESDNENMRA